MAVHISLDLENATLADVARVVEAARAAGLRESTPVDFDGSTLTISGAGGNVPVQAPQQTPQPSGKPVNVDAALNLIAELLRDNNNRG